MELLGPILAGRTLDNPTVTFHPRHIPERYGLFTLIVRRLRRHRPALRPRAGRGSAALGRYDLGARAVLAGGVGLFLLGIAFVDRVNEGATNDRVLLGTVVLLVPVTALGSLLSPLVFTATVSLILLALTIYETLGAEPPEG